MPQFCSACGAQMADGTSTCVACGKANAQPAGGGAAAAPAVQAGGLDRNIASALSYLFIPAIIFLLMEPYNKDKVIRFHSFQAIFLAVGFFVVETVMGVTLILALLTPLLGLAHLIIAIVAAVKAFNGNKMVLPVIGPMAQTQADK
jgi:uncharacterized membrane protein